MSINDILRQLPSVNDLLQEANVLIEIEGHARTVRALRDALDAARVAIRNGAPLPTNAQLIEAARTNLQTSNLQTRLVINATGVIIHTNLGRAPLSDAAQEAMLAAARDYSPLEFDLSTGERGKRGEAVEKLLCELTGAEAALVVNNCAAATTLMLAALAHGKGVVISRGQLVEIGGGFRIPEILEQSGAHLIEVGTTNKVRRWDYEKAIKDDGRWTMDDCRPSSIVHRPPVGAILRVHSSNFKMIGFVEDVPIEELVAIASKTTDDGRQTTGDDSSIVHRPSSIVVLDDLGSGALIDTSQFGLSKEPMPQDSIRAGASVVTFSGDKLLGGPQAGVMVGQREAIERCRKHPLARAFRADKFTLAALGATLLHYARGEAHKEVPVIRMMAMTKGEIAARAERVRSEIDNWLSANGLSAELMDGESTVGGGSLPGETLPTTLIAVQCVSPDTLAAELRAASTPIIARIREDRILLDPRTVLDDEALIHSLQSI